MPAPRVQGKVFFHCLNDVYISLDFSTQPLNGVEYRLIDDRGLHVVRNGEHRVLEADTIVICAGQEPDDRLAEALRAENIPCDVGGARFAAELDAARAIREGTQLAHRLGVQARVHESSN